MVVSGWEERVEDEKEDFQNFIYLHKYFSVTYRFPDELPLQFILFLSNINPRMKIKIQRDYFKEFWFSDFNFSNSSS
jgi:hypothetical protein